MSLSLVVLGLAALAVLVLLGARGVRAFLAYRGTRVVVCPESHEMAAIGVDALHAARGAATGQPALRLESCTHWPERGGCGQHCLGQVESAPQACLLVKILEEWYAGKSCAFCARVFESLHWHDHRPALVAADGRLVDWDGFRPEQVQDVLAAQRPVCWDCRIAEGFRREHAALVTDRPQHKNSTA
jgi:hypothetical protein